jgi:transposase InsO family protein
VIELDKRYRSSWDVRSIAHVTGVGRTAVARILREERGARPAPARPSHERRTRFLRRDVMWSSDFMELPDKRKLLKTIDEASRFKLAWDVVESETAKSITEQARQLIARMGRKPLVWKFDHGAAFTSRSFKAFLAEQEIVAYPIPPRAPWANGRIERDNKELQNWLAPAGQLGGEELERDIDAGMLLLNYVKPRAVLGYRSSAAVYFKKTEIAEPDRAQFIAELAELKRELGNASERVHRKAVRLLLQKWGLYEEWERSENVKRLEACYVS